MKTWQHSLLFCWRGVSKTMESGNWLFPISPVNFSPYSSPLLPPVWRPSSFPVNQKVLCKKLLWKIVAMMDRIYRWQKKPSLLARNIFVESRKYGDTIHIEFRMHFLIQHSRPYSVLELQLGMVCSSPNAAYAVNWWIYTKLALKIYFAPIRRG